MKTWLIAGILYIACGFIVLFMGSLGTCEYRAELESSDDNTLIWFMVIGLVLIGWPLVFYRLYLLYYGRSSSKDRREIEK